MNTPQPSSDDSLEAMSVDVTASISSSGFGDSPASPLGDSSSSQEMSSEWGERPAKADDSLEMSTPAADGSAEGRDAQAPPEGPPPSPQPSTSRGPRPRRPPPQVPQQDCPAAGLAGPVNLPSRPFVGLRNHGNTCYLNSVIQSLYFTPEFRDAVFKWKILKNSSLARALQIVFAQLKISQAPVSTRVLFDSPEWTFCNTLRQMDIQEFEQELFDKLEESLNSPDEFTAIKELFTGVLTDYIKCLRCNKLNSHDDCFMDISLPLRGPNSQESYLTIEQALHCFIKPELLRDGDQYYCENCNQKCDALKGLSFKKIPTVLTLMLKRFNYAGNHYKMNDRVVFPLYLDVGEFLQADEVQREKWSGYRREDVVESNDEMREPSAKLHRAESAENDNGNTVPAPLKSHVESKMNGNRVEEEPPKLNNGSEMKKDQAKNIYELYAVLVHGGSVSCGHYFAYIKSVESKQWFKFDDKQVDMVPESHVRFAYGGKDPADDKDSRRSDGNAYMLLYRKLEDDKKFCIESAVLPPHMADLLESDVTKKLLNFYFTETNYLDIYDVDSLKNPTWKQFSRPGGITVRHAFLYCLKHCNISNSLSHLYRLVMFDPQTGIVERSLDQEDEVLTPRNDHINLWLQCRSPEQPFTPRPVQSITPCVILLHAISREVQNIKSVTVETSRTVGEFKKAIAAAFTLPDTNDFQLIMEIQDTPPRLLDAEELTMTSVLQHTSVVRFFATTEPKADDFEMSYLYDEIKELRNTSHIFAVLPPTSSKPDNAPAGSSHVGNEYMFKCCDQEELNRKDGYRRVLLTIDNRCSLAYLRAKFAELVNIDPSTESIIMRTSKLINATYEDELIGNVTVLCKTMDPMNLFYPSFQFRIYIQDELAKIKACVLLLNLKNHKNPLGHEVELDLDRNATVAAVKKDVVNRMSEVHGIVMPHDMIRLRLLDRGSFVGKVLNNKDEMKLYQDVLTAVEGDNTLKMCVQAVAPGEKLFSSKEDSLFLFVQKYEGPNAALGEVGEVFLKTGGWNEFACKLTLRSNIPVEHLGVMLGVTKFPCRVFKAYNTKMSTWWPITKIFGWWENRVYTDGQVIFYRDNRVYENPATVKIETQFFKQRHQRFLHERRSAELAPQAAGEEEEVSGDPSIDPCEGTAGDPSGNPSGDPPVNLPEDPPGMPLAH